MLAKSGKLPTRGAWAFEVKWDGFRAIVSTEGPLRLRSRRSWNMTEHVGSLEQLPVQRERDLHGGGRTRTRRRGAPVRFGSLEIPQICCWSTMKSHTWAKKSTLAPLYAGVPSPSASLSISMNACAWYT